MGMHKPQRPGLTSGETLLISFFLAIGVILAIWTAYRQFNPEREEAPVPVADAALKYVRQRKLTPTQERLATLLAAPATERTPTQPHPLLGRTAPEFELNDHLGVSHQLKHWLAKGPVLVVFYYGYHCDHCVSQLFDLNEDLGLLSELGTTVVAISGDPSDHTSDMFKKYGAFRFPVLSDPNNVIAAKYGCYTPATGAEAANLLHGTFVVDRQGVVRWANRGEQPFMGIKTLVHELNAVK